MEDLPELSSELAKIVARARGVVARSLKLGNDAFATLVVLHANLVPRPSLSEIAVYRVFLTHELSRRALTAMGVDGHDVLFALVHGLSPALDTPPLGDIEVLFHDDDVSTIPFVVEVLEQLFGLSPEAAREATRQVHERGAFAVACIPLDEALVKVTALRAKARVAHMPLRVSIQPAAALPTRGVRFVGPSDTS